MTYFSDRESGERPRTHEEIGERVIAGLWAFVDTKIEDGSFGVDHPRSCLDGLGPTGTDTHKFLTAMRTEIPDLPDSPTGPLGNSLDGPPRTIDILDMLEFCWRHIGDPCRGTYHDFFQHYHLTFDREAGRQKFSEKVNSILSRNGIAYTLTGGGAIERLGPSVLNEELGMAQFNTGDLELDHILETARRKFLNPSEEIRREALLELWDGWERLKTTGVGTNKGDQISSLLDDAAGSAYPKFRERLETDAKELTSIGNNHQIRHTEVSQEKVEKSEHIDYLFHRLFSMIQLILNTKGT